MMADRDIYWEIILAFAALKLTPAGVRVQKPYFCCDHSYKDDYEYGAAFEQGALNQL